ncbi:hypothetical protein LPJ66_002266 [Kickxella alabastrina]|uniref:Uncharacterized protein n=1 Tax=Kickxella alabastrina TaxID=61397 RepID=A0ACC1IQW8_9FUNG|nr:hypothetical protein LPJ66_002266 [Kickxella alabastrina]
MALPLFLLPFSFSPCSIVFLSLFSLRKTDSGVGSRSKVSSSKYNSGTLGRFERMENTTGALIDGHATNAAKYLCNIVVENLLNPCKCPQDKFCKCCRPIFTNYLKRNYPQDIVDESTISLGAQLVHTPKHSYTPSNSSGSSDSPGSIGYLGTSSFSNPECPSGPTAACCKTEAEPYAQAQLEAESPPAPAALGQSSCCLSGPKQVSLIEKPNCDCGCDCRAKLELLIQTIEQRIGQPLNIGGGSAPYDGVDPSDWVESILMPFPSALSSDTQSISGSVTSNGNSSTRASTLIEDSQCQQPLLNATVSVFAAGVDLPVVSTGGCCGSTAPSVQIVDGSAKSPAAAGGSSCCASLNPPAKSVLPPSSSSSVSVSSCCAPSSMPEPSSVKQAPPQTKSCCASNPTSSAMPSSCCGGNDGSTGGPCQCSCRKRKRPEAWQPGDPDNPETDADGALACSCGCQKPFEECTDCFEDLCEDVLLRSKF